MTNNRFPAEPDPNFTHDNWMEKTLELMENQLPTPAGLQGETKKQARRREEAMTQLRRAIDKKSERNIASAPNPAPRSTPQNMGNAADGNQEDEAPTLSLRETIEDIRNGSRTVDDALTALTVYEYRQGLPLTYTPPRE